MATEASTWYVEKYKSGVLMEYQSQGHVLRGTYMPPAQIDGKKMYFPKAGKGSARKMEIGSDLVPMNAGRSRVELTTEAYQAAEYVYQVDLDRMSANENAVAQQQAALALGRKHDSIIYDEIHAGTGTYGTVIGAFDAAWDLAKALSVSTNLYKRDVPEDGRAYCMIPQLAFSQMMGFEEFSSADWVRGDLPFMKVRRAKFWGGVNWFTGPDELFPTSTNDVTFYAWHWMSIGSGYNGNDLNTRVTWENSKTGWLHNNWMDMGATVLQGGTTGGIIECRFQGNSAITIN